LPVLIEAEILFELKDNFKYPKIAVGENNIYIWDDPFNGVYIYSKQDFRRIGKFSQQGQGPGDLTRIQDFIIGSESIFINSTEKISYYSHSGKMLKEKKKNPGFIGLIPVGKNFICKDYTSLSYATGDRKKGILPVFLLNSKLKKKKNLFQFELISNRGPKKIKVFVLQDCNKYVVDDKRIYLGDTKRGFFFVVFDARGKKLYEITKEVKKRKVTKKEKKIIMDGRRNSLRPGLTWAKTKSLYDYIFPEYYPAFLNFSVNNNKIYIIMYPDLLEDNQTVLITNEKGDLLNKKKLTL
jgi:hypothetical protein